MLTTTVCSCLAPVKHLLIQEIIAYLGYNNIENALSYWHTYSGYEVDTVLSERDVDNTVYSIDGRVMGTSIENLPKGIYIQGGKKILK